MQIIPQDNIVGRPRFEYNTQEGVFIFSGYSQVSNSSVYDPIKNVIESYISNPTASTKIICKFEYFNTSTSRILMEVFYMFEKIYNKGKDVKIEWHYPALDVDMKNTGKLYQELLDIPFIFIEE